MRQLDLSATDSPRSALGSPLSEMSGCKLSSHENVVLEERHVNPMLLKCIGVQHVLTAKGILNSLRRSPARTLGMLQALETDENAAPAMQHEQEKAVHSEPWQSSVKTKTTTVQIAKPINPNAVRTLLAVQEQVTRTGTPKSNTKSNEKSDLTKAAPPATRKRRWESESENEESEDPEEDEGEDEEEEDDSDASDEGVTIKTPAKGMKWLYVPYQAEATDEWKVAPGIARRF